MGKKFLIFFVLILATLAAIPYGMGFFIQREHAHIMQTAFHHSGTVNVHLDKYKRGWLHSSAKYTMTIIPPEGDFPGVILQWRQKILHGPVIFDKYGQKKIQFGLAVVHAAISMPDAFFEKFGLQAEPDFSLVGQFFVNFHHFVQGQLHMPKFALQIAGQPDMTLFHMKDTAVNIAFDYKRKEGAQETTVGQIVGALGPVAAKASNLVINEVFNYNSDFDLWLGKVLLKLAEFQITAPGETSVIGGVHLQGLENSIDLAAKEKEVFIDYNLMVDDLDILGKPNNALRLGLIIGGLDGQALSKMFALLRNAHMTSSVNEEQLQQDIMALLPAVFQHGVHVMLTPSRLKTSYGTAQAGGKVMFPPFAPERRFDVQNKEVLRKLRVDVKAMLDNGMVTHVAEKRVKQMETLKRYNASHDQETGAIKPNTAMALEDVTVAATPQSVIDEWVKDKWLVPEGDQYSIVFSCKEGVCYVNGRKELELDK